MLFWGSWIIIGWELEMSLLAVIFNFEHWLERPFHEHSRLNVSGVTIITTTARKILREACGTRMNVNRICGCSAALNVLQRRCHCH